jgi:hypothetical protein
VFYNSLATPQKRGTHVTMFYPDYDYRKKVDTKIKELCASKVEEMMNNFRALYSNFMIKESGAEGDFPLHQDWTYVDEEKFSSYAFWIPLQNVNENNGALHVVRGSHRLLTRLRGPFVQEPFQQVSAAIKSKYSESINLKAGEALVWDHRLLHFSLPNISASPRLAFTLIAVPQKAPVFHYFGLQETGGTSIEKYLVDTDFYLHYTIGKRPEGVELLETKKQESVYFSEGKLAAALQQAKISAV